VLREIRQDAPRLPVIIVTGYPDSELMQEALKHSPVMMLAKPVHPTRLLAAVEQVLGTRNAERGRRNS
jgi:DNA-binding NtrC family response regulator